jgi:hypothetical protein
LSVFCPCSLERRAARAAARGTIALLLLACALASNPALKLVQHRFLRPSAS